MRAWLLCTLGAVLIWFAWHSLSNSSASAAGEPPSPGTMLVPHEQPETTPAVEAQPPMTTDAATSVAAPPVPQAAPEAVAPEPRPNPTAPPIAVISQGAELGLARALVSDPEGFCGLVAQRADLPPARRDLALALGRALEGRTDEARQLAETLAGSPLVRASEREFLTRLIGGKVTAVEAASATSESPLSWAALLVSEARDAEAAANQGQPSAAVRDYSSILIDYVRAPWASDPSVLRRWSEGLAKVQRRHRWSRNGEWPAVSLKVEPGDTLIGLRKRVMRDHPEVLVCNGLIQRVNELRGDTLRVGETLRIPTERPRMLVDLDAHWAFFLIGSEVGAAWEVGVGRDGGTRPGAYLVGELQKEPMWFRQGQEPVPYGDPRNALGTRWITWTTPDGRKTGLGFHGTNEPESIGKDESQGCIRMRNPDVEELFEILPRGAAIEVQP